MIQDIHDEDYTSPLETLKDKKKENTEKRSREVNDILWFVAFILSCCFAFFYMIAIYFTYFENPKDFEKTFSNNQRQIVTPSNRQKNKKQID